MQNQCKYNFKDNNNIKLAFAYIKKMQNIIEDKILAIDKIISSTKAIIYKKKLNINIKKI